MAFVSKGCTRSPVAEVDAVDVGNVFESRQVDLFGRANAGCNVFCCAAKRRITGECGASCVNGCALSKLEAAFSTQVAEGSVPFAEWGSYFEAICGY